MQRFIGDVCVLFAQNVEHGKRRGGVVHLMRARKRQRKRQAVPRERGARKRRAVYLHVLFIRNMQVCAALVARRFDGLEHGWILHGVQHDVAAFFDDTRFLERDLRVGIA